MSVENITSGVMVEAVAGPLATKPVVPQQTMERVQAERVLPQRVRRQGRTFHKRS
jgi:hypothetical protein